VRTEEVAVEEPLEIRIAGDTVAITMRTPGHDRELVLGFLWAEGIVSDVGGVSAIAHCGRPGDEGYGNTIEVTLAPGVRFDPDHAVRRGTVTTSACGICGRRSIDDLLARMSRLEPHEPIASAGITRVVRTLRDHQPLFARTGGCHAASLATHAGEHVATFEDVGRHNAVDKLVGARLLAGALAREAGHCMLVVSGRTSFEIVQKAFAARVPIVAGISAPSTLAVDLARRVGITLLGFVRTPSDRDGSMNVYAGADRVT
jgi:FdhD protein